MATVDELKKKSFEFRKSIENCDINKTQLLRNDFPIMCCKTSSLLLSYHLLNLWPDLNIVGIGGCTGKEQEITHYWLEVNDIVIDITGDQYNILEEFELNENIINHRPFIGVNIEKKKDSNLYQLFDISYQDLLENGFPTFAEDFIESIEYDYSLITSNVHSKLFK